MPENLKNVLLIMAANGLLVPPSTDPEQEKLWTETWKRIDRFLPELRKDLALDRDDANEGGAVAATEARQPAAGEPERAGDDDDDDDAPEVVNEKV